MKRLLIFLLPAVMLFMAPASMGEITSETQTFDFLLSPGTSTLTFTQFDDMGGTLILEGVTLDLNASESADVTVQNSSKSNDGDVFVDLSGQVSASVDALLATVDLLATDGPVNIPTASSGQNSIPGEGNFLLDATGSDTGVLTLDLSSFIGTGTIGVTLDGQGSLAASGGLGTYTLIEDSFAASGSVTITYEFCEIPEPATMGILSLGGLVMFYFRKR
jgi:hypothetical protein